MNFGKASISEEPEISLTSLIDVVFILIIFFVVTTSFDPRAALKLELPTADAPVLAEVAPPLVLVVDAQGRYFIDGQELLGRGAGGLVRALAPHAGRDGDQLVILRADARAAHQSVVTALDALGQAGITRISIATTPESDR